MLGLHAAVAQLQATKFRLRSCPKEVVDNLDLPPAAASLLRYDPSRNLEIARFCVLRVLITIIDQRGEKREDNFSPKTKVFRVENIDERVNSSFLVFRSTQASYQAV